MVRHAKTIGLWIWVLALVAKLGASAADQQVHPAAALKITAPPDSFYEQIRERDRDAARNFYKKYALAGGLPIVAADVVADTALLRTHEIVTRMLAGRPDLLDAMAASGMYLIIIGRDQVYTDMPEYRLHPNPIYQNERVRGTGGKPTSFGEENLLSLPLDRYDDESIAVHEFSHTVDGALRSIDPGWTARRNAAFASARRQGLYENTYASSNAGEYWAEICQAYFDCNRVNNWNHGPIGSREQLRVYDPEGYELVRSTFRLSPEQDWRYRFFQPHPVVIPPPARFKIDPYYTKFTWAREFAVVGRGASDEALLKANDTVRRMFAYRHDILKALIAENLKLVVLGRGERLADLPEVRSLADKSALDLTARCLEYQPGVNLLVVAEENIDRDLQRSDESDDQVLRAFAGALHQVAGKRPIDPGWESRPRGDWQQYELRLQRLDRRFDERLAELYSQAVASNRWRATAAVHDPARYWIMGVLAYFDAAGQHIAPIGSERPVVRREDLRQYDPDLYALVQETFAYAGKPDWRLKH